jgi:hypothetical protein
MTELKVSGQKRRVEASDSEPSNMAPARHAKRMEQIAAISEDDNSIMNITRGGLGMVLSDANSNAASNVGGNGSSSSSNAGRSSSYSGRISTDVLKSLVRSLTPSAATATIAAPAAVPTAVKMTSQVSSSISSSSSSSSSSTVAPVVGVTAAGEASAAPAALPVAVSTVASVTVVDPSVGRSPLLTFYTEQGLISSNIRQYYTKPPRSSADVVPGGGHGVYKKKRRITPTFIGPV